MKESRIAGILLLALVSCERNEEPHPGDSPTDLPPPGLTATEKPAEKKSGAPGAKAEEGPILVEKKPPVAEPAPGQPGKVISPFNGQLIDVSGMEPGSLVADPTYPLEEKKHFRVPEMPMEPAKPPGLLDPSILIRPKGPPKEAVDEP